jgi:hypothetical protein
LALIERNKIKEAEKIKKQEEEKKIEAAINQSILLKKIKIRAAIKKAFNRKKR